MDILTHTATGILLGRAFTKDKQARAVSTLTLVSSLLPDLDYISRLWGVDVFLRYHRGLTHSITFLITVPLILALFWRSYTGRRFGFWFVIAFFTYGIHLFMDLITQYPMRLLAPFSWKAYNWDLVFIIDPYITGAIVIGLYLSFKSKKPAQRAHIVTAVLCFLALYVGLRATLKRPTGDFLERQLNTRNYNLYPLPNDFLRWWFVAEDKKGYKTGFVDLFTESICLQDIFDKDQNNPLIKKTMNIKEVKNFLYFARYAHPIIYHRTSGTRVLWKELSYAFLPGDHFTAIVDLDRAGNVKRAYVKIR